jgi:dihydroorotase
MAKSLKRDFKRLFRAGRFTRGLKVDVGHGSHFSYRLARSALDAGIVPDTLGADMHGYNTMVEQAQGTPDQHPDEENHPFAGCARFSLTQAMSSMLALGLPLSKVIPMVTTNAAEMLGLSDRLGSLAPGRIANISVLFDLRGRFVLQDNEHTTVMAERLLQPDFCLRAGQRFDAVASILPAAIAA